MRPGEEEDENQDEEEDSKEEEEELSVHFLAQEPSRMIIVLLEL